MVVVGIEVAKNGEFVSRPLGTTEFPSSETNLKRGFVCGGYVRDNEKSPMVVVVTCFVSGIRWKNNLKLYLETWPASLGSMFLEMTTLLQLCWGLPYIGGPNYYFAPTFVHLFLLSYNSDWPMVLAYVFVGSSSTQKYKE